MRNKSLEEYFKPFRKNIVGINQTFQTPHGRQVIHYFDWTASGRLYGPIEEKIKNIFGAHVGNTHSESTETGMDMTIAYEEARKIIKSNVNAGDSDAILMVGTGATGAINKLQRILGLKYLDQINRINSFTDKKNTFSFSKNVKPVVFISQMEHHSNQITWLDGGCDVVVIPTNKDGIIDLIFLEKQLIKYKGRKIKIGSFTACSNVTGLRNPMYDLAKIMHKHKGYCFVDYAASAPYIKIDMNPKEKSSKLDAIFISPHKFLGGPGTPGLLVFNKSLYDPNLSPENSGGGTVRWTNPWGGRRYYDDIETREDGGTPAFLQTIRAALTFKLKEKMGVDNILRREEYLLGLLLKDLRKIPDLHIFDDNGKPRLGIVSFGITGIHYNLIVKILNDRFGIQTRGGCSCAGTYGHVLFDLDKNKSHDITCAIDAGDQSTKPGWVRVSLHPTLLNSEVRSLIQAVKQIVKNYDEWRQGYVYSKKTNEFTNKKFSITKKRETIMSWFKD